MKVAKNMDSVFANCTQDELDFDVLFDNDDTIIDFVAGVDEAGVPLTGPDFDFSKILAEADMLEDPDDEKEREGKVTHNTAPEGSKDVDLEVGGEVGDGKEVTGKENSSESEAHDMVKLGSETAKQTAMQKAMEIAAKKFADKESCKENADYEGYTELVEAVITGFMDEEEIMSENASQIALNTANYLISECEDAEARDGKVDPDNKGNIEGVKGEVIDKQTKGSASGDPIADDCDQAARDGKVTPDNNVEGVANRVVGAALESYIESVLNEISASEADKMVVERIKKSVIPLIKNEKDPERKKALLKRAMEQIKHLRSVPLSDKSFWGESASGDIHKDIDDQTLDNGVESMNKDIVPDDIRMNGDSNNIDIKQESTVEDAYKGLIGGMKDGLQKLALAKALDESVMETAGLIYEAAEGDIEHFTEYTEFQDIVEAVIENMTEDQLNMENASEFAIETANFVISEGGMRKFKREVARNQAKAAQNIAKANIIKNHNARNVVAPEKKVTVNARVNKNVAGKALDWVKNNPGKAAGIGAGVAAVGAGAAIAAKKIADNKKAAAAAKEEVKENYEYPEYAELVEAVVNSFTEEELMQENASEFACEVADYMIENVDDLITNDDDDDDIENIAKGEDPDVNLSYNYDDDELIDMVVNDKEA